MNNRLLIAALTKLIKNDILIKPRSRGSSGALYLKSALAGVIFCQGFLLAWLPFISGADVWVLRNECL